ncbi:MAG: YlxR family protein [Lachnospiraceae bacterium]|nr:YlxR family protein [Lachnospiraceae bacterium]
MAAAKKIPMRMCIGCGEMKSKKELIRILKTAEGEFVVDTTGRKNGRGAYLCASRECFEKSMKNHGLERSFKMKISSQVYENLKASMEEKI